MVVGFIENCHGLYEKTNPSKSTFFAKVFKLRILVNILVHMEPSLRARHASCPFLVHRSGRIDIFCWRTVAHHQSEATKRGHSVSISSVVEVVSWLYPMTKIMICQLHRHLDTFTHGTTSPLDSVFARSPPSN